MERQGCIVGVLVTAALAAATAMPVWAQHNPDGPLQTSHPILASSVERLTRGSASWREAVDAVAARGRRALVVTPDAVKTPIESDTLAQVFPIADEQSRVETVLVVINLELLQKLSRLPVTTLDFQDDVDRIVAHEVYGHAIPLLLSGSMAGQCPDPAVGQSALASCVIQRENVIRREMRLGQRFDYGRDSLASVRGGSQ